MAPPSQQDLAAALGVHPSVITRDKRKGMPIDSIDSAAAWRRENVRVRMNPAMSGRADEPRDAAAAGNGRHPSGAPDKPSGAGDDGDGYWTSRARREQAEKEAHSHTGTNGSPVFRVCTPLIYPRTTAMMWKAHAATLWARVASRSAMKSSQEVAPSYRPK